MPKHPRPSRSLGGPPLPPIDTYSAMFYALNIKTMQPKSAIYYDQVVTEFITFYRAKRRPEEFSVLDVLDWRQHLRESGSVPRTANIKVRVISAFWKWMIEVRGLSIVNIARVKDLEQTAKLKWPTLTLAQIEHLVSHIQEGRFRGAVISIIAGEGTKKAARAAGIHPNSFYIFWRALVRGAGLHWLSPTRLRRGAQAPLARRGMEALGYLPEIPASACKVESPSAAPGTLPELSGVELPAKTASFDSSS